MLPNSKMWRARADQDKAAAEAETLPMAKARYLDSAARYDLLADQSARLENAKVKRPEHFPPRAPDRRAAIDQSE